MIESKSVNPRDLLIGKYIEDFSNNDYSEVLKKDSHLDVVSFLSDYANGIIGWYDFKEDSRILQVGSYFGSFSEYLASKCSNLVILEKDAYRFAATKKRLSSCKNISVVNGGISSYSETTEKGVFDYIVCLLDETVDSIKEKTEYSEILKNARAVLKPWGTLLFAIPNKYGIKYLCGEPDLQTGIPFNGITDSESTLMRLTRQEVCTLFDEGPFKNYKIYYPLEDVRYTKLVYSDDYLPNEDLMDRLHAYIDNKLSMVLERRPFYKDVLKNKVFQFFANTFFIEASNDQLSDIIFASITTERKKSVGTATVIHKNGIVRKKALGTSTDNLKSLLANTKELADKKIPVLPMEFENNALKMKYVGSPNLSKYLQTNKSLTSEELISIEDKLWSYILQSSEHVEAGLNSMKAYNEKADFGVILKKAYTEMIPVNCFYEKGSLVFFDQEFSKENCPAGFVMFRVLNDINNFVPESKTLFPLEKAKERFGLTEVWDYYVQEESKFQQDLGNADLYQYGFSWEWPCIEVVYNNRKALANNDIATVNKAAFESILASEKKLIVWGTGNLADQFMSEYGNRRRPDFFVDNDESKWNTEKDGIPVKNPCDIIRNWYGRYQVLIAENDSAAIEKQLLSMNIGPEAYGVYDGKKEKTLKRLPDFVDLPELESKKMYVFGSGLFVRKFLAFYKSDYNIAAVIDNDKDLWGTSVYGVTVVSPDVLRDENPEDINVVICEEFYDAIVKQLVSKEINNIGLYDANQIYPGRQILVPLLDKNTQNLKKKYHVGYVAGVFDLFHLGHLNMFRRAKEQCDYLIVGVTSDEYVTKLKKKVPFVPFEERIEMVRACKYVDEAVGIPFEFGGTVEAFQKYHFDVQFSGSDYVDNPWWLDQQKYLREHGADLVFFPYTQQTSSTKIKELITKELEDKKTKQ